MAKNVAFRALGMGLVTILRDHKCVPHVVVKNVPGGWYGSLTVSDTPPPGTKSCKKSSGSKPGSGGSPQGVYGVCMCPNLDPPDHVVMGLSVHLKGTLSHIRLKI